MTLKSSHLDAGRISACYHFPSPTCPSFPGLPYLRGGSIERRSSRNDGGGLIICRGREETTPITYSDVIWVTSWREVKPAVRKLSLYWTILMAVSQSSTVVKAVKSGMERSSRGWEGLQKQMGGAGNLGGQSHILG